MCLAALALDQSRRFPFVVAANRDELFARPTARLSWWSPGVGGPEILAGRDLQAGGTWMGLTAQGRFAMVTNVRRPTLADPGAPSRGEIVPRWLCGDQTAERFWPGMALAGHQPFNLVAADFRRGDCFWATSERASPQTIERGMHGLSNAALDTPWPKVVALKQRLQQALAYSDSVDALATRLFEALADRHPAPDAELPATGIPLDRERVLSPAFIRTPDGAYGTRCSTVVVTERVNKRLVTHVFERSFTPGPGVALLRRATLKDWPPKYLTDDAGASGAAAPVSDMGPVADVEPGGGNAAHGQAVESPIAASPALKKRRVRSLLKPIAKA